MLWAVRQVTQTSPIILTDYASFLSYPDHFLSYPDNFQWGLDRVQTICGARTTFVSALAPTRSAHLLISQAKHTLADIIIQTNGNCWLRVILSLPVSPGNLDHSS